MIPSAYVADQRILQFDWTIPGCTQPKIYSQTLPSFDDHLHAKNQLIPSRDIIWLVERHKKRHPTKRGGLRCYLPLKKMLSPYKNLRNQLIISTDFDDQRVLQSDSTADRTGQNQPKVVLSYALFFWCLQSVWMRGTPGDS